ncbi:MAG: lectin like domain-containing protein, partial [Candidatus Zixiibacteriota bacterium]
IATAYSAYDEYMINYVHYQPPDDPVELTHAVAIVGWNDNLSTHAPYPGAWLCKNSWGSSWGYSGYFYISYYDKYCGQEYQLGAVSFHNVEPMKYDIVHFHDYHGWRNNLALMSYEAFNAFTSNHNERLEAVSICIPEDNTNYTIRIYDTFSGGQLSGLLSEVSGNYEFRGFHTVDLPTPITLGIGNDFYIYLYISYPSLPYDCSTDVPTLLGSSQKVWVPSAAEPGQSYYKLSGVWNDLYNYDSTANFCIKGLAVNVGLNVKPSDDLESEGPSGGPFEPTGRTYQFLHKYDDPINYEVTLESSIDWLTLSGDIGGSLPPNTLAEVTVTINSNAESLCEGIHHGRVYFTNLDDPSENTSRDVTLTIGTPSVRYEWLLDTDPGWTCQGDWAFGVPTGGGGYLGWGVDPTSGHTGDNVYGYNLDGNYPPELPPTHLIMPPLDCTKLFRISLDFWRWLCIDGWGIGYISVSTNGSTWYNVYSQTSSLLDNSWNETSVNISPYADFQPTLYIRFTMEAHGATHTFGGWNIDDIQIKAIYDSASTEALQQPVNVNER